MGTIITHQRLPDATHFHLKLDRKIHHLTLVQNKFSAKGSWTASDGSFQKLSGSDDLKKGSGSLEFARCDVPLSDPIGTLASWTASGALRNLEFTPRRIHLRFKELEPKTSGLKLVLDSSATTLHFSVL